MSDRVVSVRLTEMEIEKLQALAFVDDSAMGGLIRDAVDRYIEARRSDPSFESELAAARDRQDRLLTVLGDAGSVEAN